MDQLEGLLAGEHRVGSMLDAAGLPRQLGDRERDPDRVAAVDRDFERVGPGARQRHVEDQHGAGLDLGDARRGLPELDGAVPAHELGAPLVHETDPERVLADLGPPAPHPHDEMGAGMHRREGRHPDVLEDAQHGQLPVLVDQRVIGEDREVDLHAHATRSDVMRSSCRIALTTSMPSITWPKTVCLRSRWAWGEWQMKNWLPPVSLPAWAMERVPATWRWVLRWVSHLILYPGPPVPTRGLPGLLESGSPP